jgi:excisionase family DNA binding protein
MISNDKSTASVTIFTLSPDEVEAMIARALQAAQPAPAPPDAPTAGEYLNSLEVAEMLKVQPLTIYRYIKYEGMPATKANKTWLFRRAEVMDWVKTRFASQGGAKVQKMVEQLRKKGGHLI